MNHVKHSTRIPVLGHADGVCHIYVDEQADLDQAIKVCGWVMSRQTWTGPSWSVGGCRCWYVCTVCTCVRVQNSPPTPLTPAPPGNSYSPPPPPAPYSTCTHACTHTRTHTRAHTHAHTRSHAHKYTHARTHARMHARTHFQISQIILDPPHPHPPTDHPRPSPPLPPYRSS